LASEQNVEKSIISNQKRSKITVHLSMPIKLLNTTGPIKIGLALNEIYTFRHSTFLSPSLEIILSLLNMRLCLLFWVIWTCRFLNRKSQHAVTFKMTNGDKIIASICYFWTSMNSLNSQLKRFQ